MILILLSCTGRRDSEVEEERVEETIPAVCIWDRISVRQEPFRGAAVVTRLNLGELVTYLGVSAIDSTYKNQVYYRIRLSDQRVVWVPAFSLVIGASPAVVKEEAALYLRPDLLTITDKTIGVMEIIAVLEKSDDWISFYSAGKSQHGWIQTDAISDNMEDIAFSLYARRILDKESSKTLHDKIDSILNYNLYPNSVFVSLLEEIGEKEKERMQIEEFVMQNFIQNDD